MLSSKVAEAKELILANCDNPVVLTSFGKDSLVLLELIKETGKKFPCLFFREPWRPSKYDFAEREIRDRGLVVYDYPPMGVGLVKQDGKFEIMNFHQLGRIDEYMTIPTGIVEPQRDDYLCGREMMAKPLGLYFFPWQTIFIGHKASDVDPIWGPIPVEEPVREVAGKRVVYPLIHFTHEDVVEFTHSRELRIHVERYKPSDLTEWPDKIDNPDYFEACMACIDKDREAEVFCPKLQRLIPNCSEQVNYLTTELPSYIRRS